MLHSVLDYLRRDVAVRPDAVAFADAKTQLTYRELAQLSDAVGSFIAQNSAARRPIAVLAEKSCNVVAAFMGAAKAGCYYVPLDPKHPAARLNTVLETLQPGIVLMDQAGARISNNLVLDRSVLLVTLEEVLQNKRAIDYNLANLKMSHSQLKMIFEKPYLAPEYMAQ